MYRKLAGDPSMDIGMCLFMFLNKAGLCMRLGQLFLERDNSAECQPTES